MRAYATVIAQVVSAVCCLVYIQKNPILHLEKKNFELRKGSMRKLLILGIPIGLQFSITAIGTIIVQSAVNINGATYMAGFSAAKIQNVIGMVAVSTGGNHCDLCWTESWCRAYGQGKTGCELFLYHALIWSVLEMVIVYFGGKYFTYLFIDPSETDVVHVSVTYFRTVFWPIRF